VLPLSSLHPEVRARVEWLLAVARANGIPVEITSTGRSQGTQAALRANFEQCVALGVYPSDRRLNPGMSCKYPANRPGDSAHEFAVAFDSTVPAKWLPAWTQLRELAGFRVADEQGDPIHGEVPNWRAFRDAGLLQGIR
jgi:hypothetical protein